MIALLLDNRYELNPKLDFQDGYEGNLRFRKNDSTITNKY